MRFLYTLVLGVLLGAQVVPSAPLRAAEVPPLVDVDWIKANGHRADVVVLDIRNKLGGGSEEAYLKAHIPGAVYSDYLKAGWRTKVDGVPGQLPAIASLENLIGGLGINNDKHVVIVAGGESALDMGSATRVYFTFKVLGHNAVSILDGGHKAYAADPGNPLESGWITPEPEIFTAEFRPWLLADKDQVAKAQANGTTLLDNRPLAQYFGKAKHKAAKRAGTIAGAYSLPEGTLTKNGGHFVTEAEAGGLLQSAGLETEGEQIAFCNTGHWASLGWFVSSEILGNKGAKLYDGSMVEWSADAAAPMENGAVARTGAAQGCATC